jgi:hypothetical protein
MPNRVPVKVVKVSTSSIEAGLNDELTKVHQSGHAVRAIEVLQSSEAVYSSQIEALISYEETPRPAKKDRSDAT